jgi:polyferredoxin
MDQMGYEPGLVSYTTENKLKGGTTHFMRPQLIVYGLLLLIMIGGLAYVIASRTAFELDITRDRGALYQVTPNDTIQNSYTLEVMNMSQNESEYRIKIEGLRDFITDIPDTIILHGNELRAYPISIEVDPAYLDVSRTDFEIIIYNEATQDEVAREESRFLAPLN